MNQHLEFLVAISGKSTSDSIGGSPSGDKKIFGNVGETPDYIPDIGTMIPIERAEE